jgi:WD40 repeat protein
LYRVGTQELVASFHIGAISNSIDFSPDGNWLASGSRDGFTRTWDVESDLDPGGSGLRPFLEIEAHRKGVNSVAFDPSGDRLVSGGNDAVARVWDAGTGELLAIMIGGTFTVPDIAITPGGDTLAVVNGNVVRLREFGSERIVGTFLAETSLYCIAFNPSATLLAAGDINNTIRIWNPGEAFRSGVDGYPQPVMELKHNGTPESFHALIWRLTFSPDGGLLVSAGGDHMVHIWDLNTGDLKATLDQHTRGVTSLALSSDGRLLVTGSLDGTVQFWGVLP